MAISFDDKVYQYAIGLRDTYYKSLSHTQQVPKRRSK